MWGLLPGRGGQAAAALQGRDERDGGDRLGGMFADHHAHGQHAGGVSTAHKRAATAALREAMGASGGGAARLEDAVTAGEAAAVAPSLIARARQVLLQRRRAEQAASSGAQHASEPAGRRLKEGGGGEEGAGLGGQQAPDAAQHTQQTGGGDMSCGSSQSTVTSTSTSSSGGGGEGRSWLSALLDCMRMPHFLLVSEGRGAHSAAGIHTPWCVCVLAGQQLSHFLTKRTLKKRMCTAAVHEGIILSSAFPAAFDQSNGRNACICMPQTHAFAYKLGQTRAHARTLVRAHIHIHTCVRR